MNKTIAIVINTSWNIYNFRRGLLKALQEDGYNIIAIAPRDNYSEKLESLGFEYHNIKMNNKGTNPLEDAKLIWDFYKLYKRLQPDAILQYTIKPNIYGSFAAMLLGIPVVSNISGLGTVFLDDSFSSRVARVLYKISLKSPKKVFYQNSHDRDLFIDAKLVDESKTALLPGSGINTHRFMPKEVRRKSDKLSFLFIARLLKDKGIVEYVDAARSIVKERNAKCYILGAYYEGNPTAITEVQMQEWEKEGVVTYLGVSDDVGSHIASVDCVVLPSYREGLSRVLLEVAAMEKPLITTNVPGCKEVVDDGINGYLCKVKDSNSLLTSMKKMIDLNEVERQEMGIKGRAKVIAEFDEKLVIAKYKEALLQIFNEQS
ncbi:glycosyltransferase family 1 protein [cyanobacterium G8-9]|nr:glycosyltransferase family 1 protein [cyanobacterium G8-9]